MRWCSKGTYEVRILNKILCESTLAVDGTNGGEMTGNPRDLLHVEWFPSGSVAPRAILIIFARVAATARAPNLRWAH